MGVAFECALPANTYNIVFSYRDNSKVSVNVQWVTAVLILFFSTTFGIQLFLGRLALQERIQNGQNRLIWFRVTFRSFPLAHSIRRDPNRPTYRCQRPASPLKLCYPSLYFIHFRLS